MNAPLDAGRSMGRARVLVVDDEPMVGRMLRRLLGRDYDVCVVSCGREGLKLAREARWNAILCDVMMPEFSGVDFLRGLEEQAPDRVRVVGFMSGGVFDDEVLAELEEHGRDRWLSKPFERAELEAFIADLCRR